MLLRFRRGFTATAVLSFCAKGATFLVDFDGHMNREVLPCEPDR